MKYRHVLIKWLDSRNPTSNWQFLDDLNPPLPCKCVSVGFLLSEDQSQKILASHINDLDGDIQVMGVMAIPCYCILEIREIGQ